MRARIFWTVHHWSYLQKLQLVWDKMKIRYSSQLNNCFGESKKHS